MPLCRVGTIARQVVGQLVVDPRSVDRLELERSEDRPLVQSANLVVEGLGSTTHPCLLMYDTVAVLSD